MCTIVSEWKLGKYTVLELSQKPPKTHYAKYRIDGSEYDIVPVYDLPGHIAIEAKGKFQGKTVEFI